MCKIPCMNSHFCPTHCREVDPLPPGSELEDGSRSLRKRYFVKKPKGVKKAWLFFLDLSSIQVTLLTCYLLQWYFYDSGHNYYGTGINSFYETMFNLGIQTGTINANHTDHLWTLQHHQSAAWTHAQHAQFKLPELCGSSNAEKKYQFQASMGVHQLQRLEPTSME